MDRLKWILEYSRPILTLSYILGIDQNSHVEIDSISPQEEIYLELFKIVDFSHHRSPS